MQATKGRDSRPEVKLRKILHARGLRFRVNKLVLPALRRRADIVFPAAQVAVYVDGCFWHGCPTHVVWPRTNVDWWKKKIASTQRRDRDTDRRLTEAGWRVIRIWEHEDAVLAADVIEAEVRRRSASRTRVDSASPAAASPGQARTGGQRRVNKTAREHAMGSESIRLNHAGSGSTPSARKTAGSHS